MRTHETKRWAVLTLVGAGLLVLAGCGGERYVAVTSFSGNAEVPPVTTGAQGTVTATLEGNTLTINGAFSGLQSDLHTVEGSAAHIHNGAMGTNGPIVFNLDVTTTDRRSGSLSGSKELTKEEQEAFKLQRFYVNVHTMNNQSGEIRGQFQPTKDE